jgi:hypothetical protein
MKVRSGQVYLSRVSVLIGLSKGLRLKHGEKVLILSIEEKSPWQAYRFVVHFLNLKSLKNVVVSFDTLDEINHLLGKK